MGKLNPCPATPTNRAPHAVNNAVDLPWILLQDDRLPGRQRCHQPTSRMVVVSGGKHAGRVTKVNGIGMSEGFYVLMRVVAVAQVVRGWMEQRPGRQRQGPIPADAAGEDHATEQLFDRELLPPLADLRCQSIQTADLQP